MSDVGCLILVNANQPYINLNLFFNTRCSLWNLRELSDPFLMVRHGHKAHNKSQRTQGLHAISKNHS